MCADCYATAAGHPWSYIRVLEKPPCCMCACVQCTKPETLSSTTTTTTHTRGTLNLETLNQSCLEKQTKETCWWCEISHTHKHRQTQESSARPGGINKTGKSSCRWVPFVRQHPSNDEGGRACCCCCYSLCLLLWIAPGVLRPRLSKRLFFCFLLFFFIYGCFCWESFLRLRLASSVGRCVRH